MPEGLSHESRLGGALRRRVQAAITVPLDGGDVVPTGIPRAVLTSSERDVGVLTTRIKAAAEALGPDCQLALRLDAQLDPSALAQLREQGRRLKLQYIADPCADLDQACSAFAFGAPPLAVSAHRHAQPDLARVMRDGGIQVLLVDPVRIGGQQATRMWSVAADMTGVELALVAHDDSRVAALHAAQLASTLRASTQPVVVGHAEHDPWFDFPATPTTSHRVTRVTLHRVKVPMRQLYVSAMYMRRTTERIIVELETADGMRGFGETNGTDEVLQSTARMANRLLGQDQLERPVLAMIFC